MPCAPAGGVLLLLQLPRFRRLVLVAALILGSHAMHDAFAVIRWSAAGVSPATVSVLWSESVAAEVLVFFIIGPTRVRWLTPAGALAAAALAGMLRWTVMAQSAEVIALGFVQPLHGITFALLYLACMRGLARTVPPGLEGTAQAIYGTVGIGAAIALLALASGALYARMGAQGFWGMAALCALAFPLTWRLRQPACSERRPPQTAWSTCCGAQFRVTQLGHDHLKPCRQTSSMPIRHHYSCRLALLLLEPERPQCRSAAIQPWDDGELRSDPSVVLHIRPLLHPSAETSSAVARRPLASRRGGFDHPWPTPWPVIGRGSGREHPRHPGAESSPQEGGQDIRQKAAQRPAIRAPGDQHGSAQARHRRQKPRPR
jgi:MFS_1 like family